MNTNLLLVKKKKKKKKKTSIIIIIIIIIINYNKRSEYNKKIKVNYSLNRNVY